MNNTTNQLTEWIINKIKTKYPDDVALLVAVEGISINEDGHGEAFDYFVPATERGNDLAQTFIIDGIGNDLYPRSWERMERTATLEDLTTPCLGSAKILYARSNEDIKRFESIRQKLFDNLNNPIFTYRKALETLDIAMNFYKTLMFEERLYRVRGLAGYIHYYLTVSIACLNKTYRKDWHNGTIQEISKWKDLPERFIEYYQAILSASTVSELKNLSHLLIASTRKFISQYKPQDSNISQAPDYFRLAEWYQELRTWWNRLYYFCSKKNNDATFHEACQLQNELDIIGSEFNFEDMDLLGCFDSQNLEALSHRASELEKVIILALEHNDVKIKNYNSFEEFIANEQ